MRATVLAAIALSFSAGVQALCPSFPIYQPNVADTPVRIAPVLESEHLYGTINDSYVVVLKDDISSSLLSNHLNLLSTIQQADDRELELHHVYDGVIKGYAGRFSDAALHHIRSMPEVDYIERDQIIRIQSTQYGAPWVRSFFMLVNNKTDH